ACISFVFQGVVDLATPTKWTVGGFVFNIVGAPVPTDIALDAPLVVGTTVVDVQFIPTPGAFAGPPPAIPFDALEIFPPAAAVLAVPAPLFPNPVANTVVLPSPMPPGTIAVAVIPGGTVVAVNVNAANGGQEWVIDTGVGIARVYTAADTVIRAPATVGGIVKVVADRTLAPGPLVAEVITARQVAVGGLDFLFLYQGVVTRADPDVWTIGAVDFNIVPVTGALPTDIALDAPLVGGTTVVTVEFLLAPGARLDPPTVSVTAIDAAAAETASDPAVFRITRANTTFIPLTVSFTLTGTAINGTDYSPVPLTVSMPVGTASMDVTITPIDDAVLDPNETVILTLASGTNYIVGSPNTATAIIEDNEAALSIVATKADAAETGPTNALFTVSRTGSTAADLTVSYTIGGTASNGVDYLTLSGSVLIPAGFSSATITVTPIDDAIAEGRETIILTLVLPPGFGTVAGSATASILDNDAAPTFALQFNGVNQRVDINGGGSLNLVGNLTVEAWINRAAVGVQHSVFEKFGAANSGVGGYDLRISGDRVQFEVRDDGGRAVTVTGATAIPANTWVHVAGHWDGANLRVFVNGAQDGILANNRPPRAGNTLARIGARGDDAGTPFNGQIDEVRVWNVARSAAQINANRNTCIPGNAGGLAGYWRLDNGAGAIATDSSPNGNNGTLINGPTWVPSTSPVVCVP
ncbi:MAG TPA: LamG-like jellyroll fold domain-containing protein, partial [Verrucomicrobiae bacterium]